MDISDGVLASSNRPSSPWAWVSALLVALIGVGLIALATAAMEKETKLQLIVEHVGVAVLVGGLVGLMFDLFLVRDLIERIMHRTEVVTKLSETTIRGDLAASNRRLDQLDRVGIHSAYSKLSIDKFILSLVSNATQSGDNAVRIFQSFSFSPGIFPHVAKEAILRGRGCYILLGDPSSAFVQHRVAELNMADKGREADEISNLLRKMMADIRDDRVLFEASQDGRLQVRTYKSLPAAAIWGVGNDFLVSWFFKHKASISLPHVHCKAGTRLRLVEKEAERRHASLGDEVLAYFNSVWSSATPVSAD